MKSLVKHLETLRVAKNRWLVQINPETPEHFNLSPLSERRATGKVRKYYEPASFIFVDDEAIPSASPQMVEPGS